FGRSARPRPLHSFPTRRSSDLHARLARDDRLIPLRRIIDGEVLVDQLLVVQLLHELECFEILRRLMLRHEPAVHFAPLIRRTEPDRKSTRLNSSHVKTSYAVFC